MGFLLLALGGSGVFPFPTLADRISLRQGQPIKGKLITDKTNPSQYLLICEVGKTPMVIKKDQVVQVTPEKSPLDEYVVRLEKDRPDAEAEFLLGTWCEDHHLKDLASVHYDLAVKRDSTFEPAHQKLGHVLMNGRWLNGDEVKEAQGMVKFQGRWMTPEERERRELLASKAAEGSSWSRRIKVLREGYLSPQRTKSEEAERRLLAIDEAIAVGPVLKVLGEDPLPAVRAMASKVLGGIPGPEASNGLVGRFLIEEDEAVRQVTMNELARRDRSEILPLLGRSLRSAHHEIVNRSAWGLGNLNVTEAVPRLIPALITIEHELMMVESGGSGGGGGIGFNSSNGSGGPLIGGRTTSIPILTGPAVAPGAVAYGATSVPFIGANGSGYGVGSGGGSRGSTLKLVPIEYRNDEVLRALIKLTGKDFGYDIPTWKQWLATSFKIDTPPARRVREP